jgi:hypothetical protein
VLLGSEHINPPKKVVTAKACTAIEHVSSTVKETRVDAEEQTLRIGGYA